MGLMLLGVVLWLLLLVGQRNAVPVALCISGLLDLRSLWV